MDFVCNFPLFCIILTLLSGPISMILNSKQAKRLNMLVIIIAGLMNFQVFIYTLKSGFYIYRMGHYFAPWGNEIRVGVLESMMATFMCCILFIAVLGGARERDREVEPEKQNLYFIMINLVLSSVMALLYTNDLFTAYVFVEINTLASAGLIMSKQNGHTIEATMRYMIMSLLGSGMILLGIVYLYTLTGHLLMSNIKQQIVVLTSMGDTYTVPLTIAVGLISIGIAIKSALFPFHSWLPDAYGYSTVSSATVLSCIVSKSYIFLLVKIFYRVIGMDFVYQSKVINVLFVFGIAGMILGSVSATKENDIRRMTAFSSVAQIGYIYMGFGLGTEAGIIASVYHIFSHAIAKSLVFLAGIGICDVSKDKRNFASFTGAAYRYRLAAFSFGIGSLSMVGFPFLCGFISKLLFAEAGILHPIKALPTGIALAISTILNAVYFLKTVIRLYVPAEPEEEKDYLHIKTFDYPEKAFCFIVLIIAIVAFGMVSDPVINTIKLGLSMFG